MEVSDKKKRSKRVCPDSIHRVDYEALMEDGRFTEPSNFRYDFNVREAIELSKKKGRPLTEGEVKELKRRCEKG